MLVKVSYSCLCNWTALNFQKLLLIIQNIVLNESGGWQIQYFCSEYLWPYSLYICWSNCFCFCLVFRGCCTCLTLQTAICGPERMAILAMACPGKKWESSTEMVSYAFFCTCHIYTMYLARKQYYLYRINSKNTMLQMFFSRQKQKGKTWADIPRQMKTVH